jgi:hypothetical protein
MGMDRVAWARRQRHRYAATASRFANIVQRAGMDIPFGGLLHSGSQLVREYPIDVVIRAAEMIVTYAARMAVETGSTPPALTTEGMRKFCRLVVDQERQAVKEHQEANRPWLETVLRNLNGK